MKAPNSKYLVYTSAGDNSNISFWLNRFDGREAKKEFDLWITYYGDRQEDRYKESCDFYNRRPGGKFPNLHYVYQQWHNVLEHYEAVFILDDDIIIDCEGINSLFRIRSQYDLWLLQPAFDPRGKISHPITKASPSCFLRFTNFVEVACPLFRKDKLENFMKIYDPILNGWGVDLWYHHLLGEHPRKIAIVDAITCINPHDITKGGHREIERLENTDVRKSKWGEVKKRFNIRFDGEDGKFQMKQFGHVEKHHLKNAGE